MQERSTRPHSLKDTVTHYCPGCGHGIAHRLLAESIDELGIAERTIGIAPVGCAVWAYYYLDFDMVEVAHGRAPAVATGLKRARPDTVVFSYQGDGDLASIGTAEIIHAANRGERITVIFVNNGVYGMTSGQMAPTTLVGQKTSTTPLGRDPQVAGYPMHVCELLSQLRGCVYAARAALSSPANIRTAKKYILRALGTQLDELGFSIVELLSPCPTYWRMEPAQAMEHINEHVVAEFPLGEIKTPDSGEAEGIGAGAGAEATLCVRS